MVRKNTCVLDIMCRREICDFKKSNPYFWKGDVSFRCDYNQGTINCLWQILKTHPKCGEVQIMDTFVSNISWEISFGNICIIWKKFEFLCPVLNVCIIWKYFHYLYFMWKYFVCPISELCIILKYQPSFEGENYINPFYPALCQSEC